MRFKIFKCVFVMICTSFRSKSWHNYLSDGTNCFLNIINILLIFFLNAVNCSCCERMALQCCLFTWECRIIIVFEICKFLGGSVFVTKIYIYIYIFIYIYVWTFSWICVYVCNNRRRELHSWPEQTGCNTEVELDFRVIHHRGS